MGRKYQLEVYRLDVENQTFRKLDILENYKDLRYAKVNNNIGSAKFKLNIFDPKATSTNIIRYSNYIAIKRNGVYEWVGQIVDYETNFSDVGGEISVECATPLFSLKDTFTEAIKIYDEQNISLIAWDLINEQQNKTNGWLGFTQGSLATAVSRPAKYEYKSRGDAITELSRRLGGFDFLISPKTDSSGILTSFEFSTIYPRRATLRRDLNFELGKNIDRIAFRTSSPIYNQGLVIGQGTGESIPVYDLGYESSQKAFTRRELVLTQKDTSNPALLSKYLETILNESSSENVQMQLVLYGDAFPRYGQYNIGDVIFVTAKLKNRDGSVNEKSLLNFEKKAVRIVEIEVSVDDQEVEYIIPKVETV